MNAKLKKYIKATITHEIKRSARKEAFKILEKSDAETVGRFLFYHHSDMGNICCLVLDTAKNNLVYDKKIKQRKGDSFGKINGFDKFYPQRIQNNA